MRCLRSISKDYLRSFYNIYPYFQFECWCVLMCTVMVFNGVWGWMLESCFLWYVEDSVGVWLGILEFVGEHWCLMVCMKENVGASVSIRVLWYVLLFRGCWCLVGSVGQCWCECWIGISWWMLMLYGVFDNIWCSVRNLKLVQLRNESSPAGFKMWVRSTCR